jgi:hypothetical protein
MDDQNQNPVVSQPQNAESQKPPANPTTLPEQKPKRVLQPSAELVKDMAANPNSYYARKPTPNSSTAPNTQSPNSTSEQTQTPKTPNNMSSIYPEATKGLSDDTVNENEPAARQVTKPADNTLTKLIIVGVIALGIFIAVPAIFSIIGSVKIISYGNISVFDKAGIAIYIIDAIYLIVGVGLILRKELARIAYVVIGIILLLIGLYGTVKYFRESHSVSGSAAIYADETTSAQTGVNGDQTTISNYENNTSIPAAQKQQIISGLESDLKKDQQQLSQDKQLQKQNSGINALVKLIPTYLLAILPLVFLTRSKVKEVFS